LHGTRIIQEALWSCIPALNIYFVLLIGASNRRGTMLGRGWALATVAVLLAAACAAAMRVPGLHVVRTGGAGRKPLTLRLWAPNRQRELEAVSIQAFAAKASESN
jgi:hypothetical protein